MENRLIEKKETLSSDDKRIIAITHMHELAAKDERFNIWLWGMYQDMLQIAKKNNIPVSKLIIGNNLFDEND